MGILVAKTELEEPLFPESGLLASQFQTAKYHEPPFKMCFYSSIIPYIYKNIIQQFIIMHKI